MSKLIIPNRIYMSVDPLTALVLVGLGVFIGLLSGMFGFGGSSISTPLLRMVLNIPAYIALGSPLPMTLVSSSIATYQYNNSGNIDWHTTLRLVITVIPGSILGAYLTAYISGKALMLFTAFFLLYVAIRFIVGKDKQRNSTHVYALYAAGFLIGFVSGLLANGGGILVTPVLVLLGMKMKRAIGTSLALVLLGTIPSIIIHWYLGHINLLITLFLILGALPGSYIGARTTISTASSTVKRGYGVFLLLFSLFFLAFELVRG